MATERDYQDDIKLNQATLITTLRAFQVIATILLLASISAIIFPITIYGLTIGCIILLIWEWKIEKKIKDKKKEMNKNDNASTNME